MKEGFDFGTRHSDKIKENKGLIESEKYPGLTAIEGIRLAEKTVHEQLKPMIDQLPANAIMAILGASDQIRTKSTVEIYGDELKKCYQNDEKVSVKARSDINKMKEPESKVLNKIVEEINQNPDKKFIIDYPMFIKEFAMEGRWVDEKGEYTPFCKELLKATNDDNDLAILKWVESNGEFHDIKGPKPEEVAQSYKKGFERLREFAGKQVPDRHVYIGGVGHGWDMDAFVAYMSHGKVDMDTIKEIMGKNQKGIEQTEPFYFKVEEDKIKSNYRGRDYELQINNEENKQDL